MPNRHSLRYIHKSLVLSVQQLVMEPATDEPNISVKACFTDKTKDCQSSEKLQFPFINCMQKIIVYETYSRFYVIASNLQETRFRVLKIDRTEATDLILTDDRIEYSRHQIHELLVRIAGGNQVKGQMRGLSRTVSAFALIGFVRFLEGYYMILVTSRRKVAYIGRNIIYKVEDTKMIYLPNNDVQAWHKDEARYLKLFQNVDLSSNFYFSYSYDLTHSLQHNMAEAAASDFVRRPYPCEQVDRHCSWSEIQNGCVQSSQSLPNNSSKEVEEAGKCFQNFLEKVRGDSPELFRQYDACTAVGISTSPLENFLWNRHLLRHVEAVCHPEWRVNLIHGFIQQAAVNIFTRPLYLTLIARRSNVFAGTRFLKRGAHSRGFVANEVETEQILQDMSLSDLSRAKVSSYVQLRGSIPLCWSQDSSKMIPKPSINLYHSDPFGSVSGRHFKRVLSTYGAPIIVLNLIKRREKKPHESILSPPFQSSIEYLNTFLPDRHSIRHVYFDMARHSKKANVLSKLERIALDCFKQTSLFYSGQTLPNYLLRQSPLCEGLDLPTSDTPSFQHGIIRTNCIDCLDRTNTAQFSVGKCAIGFQLYLMGILEDPHLEFDTDCCRILEGLYEEQGDTLALQYGGSQLVHRIKGYRKLNPWVSSSRDFVTTISRYYSNTFSDSEKQASINIFLGVFEPSKSSSALWELESDNFLHDIGTSLRTKQPHSYSLWWDPDSFKVLPSSLENKMKGRKDHNIFLVQTSLLDERIDNFAQFYRPFELSSLEQVAAHGMTSFIRESMPKTSADYSPFSVRTLPGRMQRMQRSSATSDSSDSEQEIEAEIVSGEVKEVPETERNVVCLTLADVFPTFEKVYGSQIQKPSRKSCSLYERNCTLWRCASVLPTGGRTAADKHSETLLFSVFKLDDSRGMEVPKLDGRSASLYTKAVAYSQGNFQPIQSRNVKIYESYLQSPK